MKITKSILLYAFLGAFLTACGGGGSDSGGASSVSADGSYTGSWTVTISAPSVPSLPPETSRVFFDVTINGTEVVVGDSTREPAGQSIKAVGTLSSNNTFTATTGPGYRVSIDGIDCVGNYNFSGKADGVTATGNGAGRVNCTLAGASVVLEISGPFSTSNNARSKSATSLPEIIDRYASKAK